MMMIKLPWTRGKALTLSMDRTPCRLDLVYFLFLSKILNCINYYRFTQKRNLYVIGTKYFLQILLKNNIKINIVICLK